MVRCILKPMRCLCSRCGKAVPRWMDRCHACRNRKTHFTAKTVDAEKNLNPALPFVRRLDMLVA